MASVNTSEVTIGGKVFKISGYESKEYLTKLAEYINDKMQEIVEGRGMTRLGFDVVTNLMYLNLADDYFKAKAMCDDISEEIDKKDQEIYNLKHELISANIKLDSQAKEIEALKKELSKVNKTVEERFNRNVEDIRKRTKNYNEG